MKRESWLLKQSFTLFRDTILLLIREQVNEDHSVLMATKVINKFKRLRVLRTLQRYTRKQIKVKAIGQQV